MTGPRPDITASTNLFEIIEQLQVRVRILEKRRLIVDGGVANVNITAANTPQAFTVNFNKAFDSPPSVELTAVGGSPVSIATSLGSVTSTAFQLIVQYASTGVRAIHWLAYDPT